MKHKSVKEDLLFSINNNDLQTANQLLKKYEKYYIYDRDFKFINAYLCYVEGNLKKAEYICNKIICLYPFHFDTYFLLQNIYMESSEKTSLEKLENLFYFLSRFSYISNLEHNIKETQNNVLNFLIKKYKDEEEKLSLIRDKLIYTQNTNANKYWGSPLENFLYKEIDEYFISKQFIQKNDVYTAFYKSLKFIAFKKYNTEQIIPNKEYILPIHSIEPENILDIKCKDETIHYFALNNYCYHLFNINNNIFNTKTDVFIGKPIPKFKFEGNKDLVLTLFIDGLSQRVIDENGGLENLMPHTYNFFKDYMYCNNFYTTAEWTYPSIASYFTGQPTTKHHLFHPVLNASLKDNQKILSEYINEKDYFTSKIDGDWRSNFPCGYYRGFDYICYEPSINGAMTVKEIPSLLIDHMETFKDANMFIHTCVPDLHDVADCFELPYSVQVKQDYDEKPIKLGYVQSETSVRNDYDENKIKSYIRMMKYIDTHLRSLYCYLEDNFDLDNVTIALISDHGQGYLVKPDEEFLSDGRIKVPFLIRSKETKGIKCNELMQNVDYMAILDKILNLNVNYKNIDSNLPACLGGKERKYTYSESLFPDAPYRAVINTRDYEFFFESKENVQFDGRVLLEEYRATIKDKKTNQYIENNTLLQEFVNIVLGHMKYFRIYI